jgi:hypothetical protein
LALLRAIGSRGLFKIDRPRNDSSYSKRRSFQ